MRWDEEEIRRFGREVADVVAHYYAELETSTIVPRDPERLARMFDEPLPEEGVDPFALLADLNQRVIPNSFRVPSPRYFGLFNPTPTVIGVFADTIASMLNQNMGAWSHGPAGAQIERTVIRWLCDLTGLPGTAFGTLTSGGTLANFTAIKTALDEVVPGMRERGVRAAPGHPTLYVSDQAHYSIDRLAGMLGIGTEGLRKIPSDDGARIRVDALDRAIREDREAGRVPFCVIGIAGTTTAGAIDPLEAIDEVCREHDLWYHVDAAWGGAVRLSRRLSPLLAGIERADSITLDPHKWFSVPFTAGAVVTRDGSALRRTFEVRSAYLTDRSFAEHEDLNLYQFGVAGTRRLDALKVWLSLRQHGRLGYEAAIERQVALAEHLSRRVEEAPDMEAASGPSLGVLCFRYRPDGWSGDERELDALHGTLQHGIERRGRIWISTSMVAGRRAFRFCATSYLTRREHVDEILDEIRSVAALGDTR